MNVSSIGLVAHTFVHCMVYVQYQYYHVCGNVSFGVVACGEQLWETHLLHLSCAVCPLVEVLYCQINVKCEPVFFNR